MFMEALYNDTASFNVPIVFYKLLLLTYFLGLNKHRKSYKIQLGVILPITWCSETLKLWKIKSRWTMACATLSSIVTVD